MIGVMRAAPNVRPTLRPNRRSCSGPLQTGPRERPRLAFPTTAASSTPSNLDVASGLSVALDRVSYRLAFLGVRPGRFPEPTIRMLPHHVYCINIEVKFRTPFESPKPRLFQFALRKSYLNSRSSAVSDACNWLMGANVARSRPPDARCRRHLAQGYVVQLERPQASNWGALPMVGRSSRRH